MLANPGRLGYRLANMLYPTQGMKENGDQALTNDPVPSAIGDSHSAFSATAPVAFAEGGGESRRGQVMIAACVLLSGAGIRILMALQDRFGLLDDTNFFVRWTRALVEHGLGGFYEHVRFCDYPPLFLLVIWVIGHGASLADAALSNDYLLRVLLKAPACLADLAIAVMLLVEGRRRLGGRRALGAMALYFLNPVSIYNSAYWGQVDAIHTALVLLALIFVGRRSWALAGAAIALALLQKFQSIAFLPLVLMEAYQYRRWRGLGRVFVGATVAAAWVCLPFALNGVLDDVLGRAYIGVVGQYNVLSPSAFNFWQAVAAPDLPDNSVPRAIALVAAGGRVSMADDHPLFWLTYRHLSLAAYVLAVALILSLYSYRSGTVGGQPRFAAAGLLGMAFFLIPTEMHERYAHPVIALLAIWAASGVWKERVYFLLSALWLLNLTHILPVEQIAGFIGGSLSLLFIVMLVWMPLSGAVHGLPEAAPDPAEDTVAPPASRLVVWFRRATYVATAGAVAGGAMLAYAGWVSREAIIDGDALYLSKLEPVTVRQGWGELDKDASVNGGILHLRDTVYFRGIGTHAPAHLAYDIPEGYTVFRAILGIDRATAGKGSTIASVDLDGRRVLTTPVLTGETEPFAVEVPLGRARRITLIADPTGDGNRCDHVDWAAARFERGPAGDAPSATRRGS